MQLGDVMYRDLRFVIPVFVQFLLYASPSRLQSVGDCRKGARAVPGLVSAKPLASLMEFFSLTLFGEGSLNVGWLAYSVGISVITFFCRRVSPSDEPSAGLLMSIDAIRISGLSKSYSIARNGGVRANQTYAKQLSSGYENRLLASSKKRFGP